MGILPAMLFAGAVANAQSEPKFSAGVYLSAGSERHITGDQAGADGLGLAGIYAERRLPTGSCPLHAGLDVRSNGTAATLVGTLVGPRLSVTVERILHPYAEALFGPNYINSTPAATRVHGVTEEAVAGLDLNFARIWAWRVIELSEGSFSGVPHSSPRALTTGIVLLIP